MSEHKFKVGDVVRIINKEEDNNTGCNYPKIGVNYSIPRSYIGKTAKISDIIGTNSYKIGYINTHDYFGHYRESDIELADLVGGAVGENGAQYHEHHPFSSGKTVRELNIDTSRLFKVEIDKETCHLKKGDMLVMVNPKNDIDNKCPVFKRVSDGKIVNSWLWRLKYAKEPVDNNPTQDSTDRYNEIRIRREMFGLKSDSIMFDEFSLNEDKLSEDVFNKMLNQFKNQIYPMYFLSTNELFNNKPPFVKGPNGLKKTMSKILNFIDETFLSEEEKLMRKVGFHNSEGNWTEDLRQLLCDLAAKDLGYKDEQEMIIKLGVEDDGYCDYSPVELANLMVAYKANVLDYAKKYEKELDKKTKQ